MDKAAQQKQMLELAAKYSRQVNIPRYDMKSFRNRKWCQNSLWADQDIDFGLQEAERYLQGLQK